MGLSDHLFQGPAVSPLCNGSSISPVRAVNVCVQLTIGFVQRSDSPATISLIRPLTCPL